MKILITGATGFIGRHLVPCLARDHDVFALARNRESAPAIPGVRTVVADLCAPIDRSLLPPRIDAIIHLAQANVPFPESANELFAVNTGSAQALLDYARNAQAHKFLLASSGDVYGGQDHLATENDRPNPQSFYAVTKYASEMLARSYSSILDPVVLRLFTPFGPGQSKRLIPKLVQRIGASKPITLNRDDRPRLTPLFIDDVVISFERALSCSGAGVLNLAGDSAVSVRDLSLEIGKLIGVEPVFEQTDQTSADLMGNNALMKSTLGSWELVNLNEGLRRTLADWEE